MENITYDDLLDRPLPEVDRKSMEFTAHSSDIVAEIVQDGIAETDDPKIIFQTLKNNIRLIPFGAYLRRYIFRSMGGKGDYDSIPVKEYKQIIMTSFRENYTPKSFHDTTVKFSTLVEGWLERDSVSRDTVFLLGFGLRMPVEDVSMFLKTALKVKELGLGLNAGHDLNLQNLGYFIKTIPWTDEVSIGHAIICDALYMGLEVTIRAYLSEIKKNSLHL